MTVMIREVSVSGIRYRVSGIRRFQVSGIRRFQVSGFPPLR